MNDHFSNELRQISIKKRFMVEKETSSTRSEQAVPLITKIFRFSADELERIKKEATSHLSSEIDYVSTFDVLTAHLYRHITPARNFLPSSTTKLYICTDIRLSLKQPIIPSIYFGNAFLYSYLQTESAHLIRINDLGYWAAQVHQAISAETSDQTEKTLAWINDQSDKSTIVLTGNLTQTDFELGVHPSGITLPLETTFYGAILCSTEKNDSSIDVILGLNINTMAQLENNIDFRKCQ